MLQQRQTFLLSNLVKAQTERKARKKNPSPGPFRVTI